MASPEKEQKGQFNWLKKLLIFCVFVIFPLGQLVVYPLQAFGTSFVLRPIDVVVVSSLPYFVLRLIQKDKLARTFSNFFLVALFSQLLALQFFSPNQIFYGTLYLTRFAGYFSLALVIADFAQKDKQKALVIRLLLAALVTSALLGWSQYVFFPDLRSLKYIGWDDHLYRLAGTFLDPGFTGLLMVFGALIETYFVFGRRANRHIVGLVLFVVTVAFTYSRASFLALYAGLACAYIISRKHLTKYVVLALAFSLLIAFLPRPFGEGVRLERVSSIYSRFSNYRQTLTIAGKNPLFGVGFNNICAARQLAFDDVDTQSHACSGSDSSLLLVLATTGAVGFMVFLSFGSAMKNGLASGKYSQLFISCLVATLVHSLFANSLFYPWVLVVLASLWGMALKARN